MISLQYHQIANINWNKLQTVAEGAITTISNLITQIPAISGVSGDSHAATTSSLVMTSLVFLPKVVCQLDLLLDLSKDDRRM